MTVQPSNDALKQEVSNFLSLGLEFEGKVLECSLSIREQSKAKYKQEWLDARLQLMAISAHLIEGRNGVPGNSSPEISERIVLIMVFLQGAYASETLISEGQYIKASAALKQDIEILARLAEIKLNVARPGRVPNVKHAPEGCQRYYGQLNDVAHPSNLHLLQALLSQLHEGEARGVSYVPAFVEETALGLYELHVWLLFEAVREHLLLFMEMYGEDDEVLKQVTPCLATAVSTLSRSGFTFG
jgi:hypothetical protein